MSKHESTRQLEAELQALQQDGLLSPSSVVQWAESNPDSELHRHFTWDDTEAARLYRLEQARGLILRVKISIEAAPGREITVRKFVSLPQDRGAGGYRETQAVLSDATLRGAMLKDALRELRSFRQKYSTLTELSKVFAAIQELEPEAAESIQTAV